MISENELKSCKARLERRDAELLQRNNEYAALNGDVDRLTTDADETSKLALKLESVVDKLTESNSQMIVQLEEKGQAINTLLEVEQSYNALKKVQASSAESCKSDLVNEKSLLIEEIDRMKRKNLKVSVQISSSPLLKHRLH